MNQLRVTIIIAVLLTCTCSCRKFLDGGGKISGYTHSRDQTFYNRAFDYADKHIAKPCGVNDFDYNIQFVQYIEGAMPEKTKYREDLKGICQDAFNAIFFDVKHDTTFLKTHWIGFNIQTSEDDQVTVDSIAVSFPLTMFQ